MNKFNADANDNNKLDDTSVSVYGSASSNNSLKRCPSPLDLQNLISSSVPSTTSSTEVWWNSVHWFVRRRANRMQDISWSYSTLGHNH